MNYLKAALCGALVAAAASINPPAAIGASIDVRLDAATDEPFASASVGVPEGPSWEKWDLLGAEIESAIAVLSDCRAEPNRCSSPVVIRFLKVLERADGLDGFAKLAAINGDVNAAIRHAKYIGRLEADAPWSTAITVLGAPRGRCVEFAIAKYIALLESGWPLSDMRLVAVWPEGEKDTHTVLAVRYNGQWRILDNIRSAIAIDTQLQGYIPLFVFDHLGVRALKWCVGCAKATPMIAAADMATSRPRTPASLKR